MQAARLKKFSRVVQRKEVRPDVPVVPRCPKVFSARMEFTWKKLIAKIGLAESVADASRKRKGRGH